MTRRRLELTKMPMPPGVPERWRKKHGGEIYYFRGDYDTALKAWHQKLAELEKEDQQQPTWYRRAFERMQEWYRGEGMTEDADAVTEVLQGSDEELAQHWRYYDERERGIWSERFRQLDKPAKTTPATIGQAVESFLAKQQVKVAAGQVSAGYYDLLQRTLWHFADHVGRRVALDNITGHALESYHTALVEATTDKKWSPDYATGKVRMVKTFLNWCYDVELIEKLPRILRRGNKSLSIESKPKKKPTFSNEEVKTLLDHSSERTQLYLLLMANCGFTQIDLSELRPDQVDWKGGRITRKRSKTEQHESVPEVSYPLWSRTFTLLKRFGRRTGDRVLVNENGKPLKVEELRSGKLVKIDNVASAYARLVRKLMKKKDGKPALLAKKKSLKAFRKTSPSRLEDSEFSSCARWFGGWSPKSVADKHYIRPPQELFDRAVRWLAKSYGLEK